LQLRHVDDELHVAQFKLQEAQRLEEFTYKPDSQSQRLVELLSMRKREELQLVQVALLLQLRQLRAQG